MLDAIPQSQLRRNADTIDTIATVLEFKFPSQASSDALERFRSRVTDPVMHSELRRRSAMLRGRMRGHWMDEAWLQAHRSMSPWEQTVHYDELLLANAAPDERVFFLVWAAQSALDAGQYGKAAGQYAKAEAYAREILATPDLAAKTGDGVYYGNHVLGMIALHQGDIAAAKHCLIESAKTPGSYELNGPRPPDPSLAIALLERGEREVVLEYLDLCKVFSKKDALIEGWKKTIRAGGTPDFRLEWLEANLGRKVVKPW
jgi:tetratricopeptide (TPR) repeat protein